LESNHELLGSPTKVDETAIIVKGHRSYPSAVEEINGIHSQCFTNEQGHHTNLIENVWSHLKTEIQTRRGVSRRNIIVEFVWSLFEKKDKKIF
jgi:hypothetical protein